MDSSLSQLLFLKHSLFIVYMGGAVFWSSATWLFNSLPVIFQTFSCKSYKVSAGVHDSFWTHAADVDKMNQILRERFVELYKQPILENVSFNYMPI